MYSKRVFCALLLAAVLLLLAAGCGSGAHVPTEKDAFYRGVDDDGTEIVLRERPHHIVSLGLSTDEILLSLASPEQIAALTSYADDPGLCSMTEAAQAVSVKIKDKSPESVLALDPDLVLVTDGVPKELADSLRDLGISVFVFHTPKRIDGIFAHIETIGQMIGQEENAAALIAEKRALLADVERRVGDIPEEKHAPLSLRSRSAVCLGARMGCLTICAVMRPCATALRWSG